MKILMVSMNSIHFQRWVSQLEDSGHEVFWFDVYDGGYSKSLSWIKQYRPWRYRFKSFRGRSFIKQNFPKLFRKLFERNIETAFEKYLNEVKPDCVHSFALYVSCSPIVDVMKKNPAIKWVYSSWGSDLFYFKNIDSYLTDIKKVLPRIDYLFTDCKRDYNIAKELGFIGKHLGVYPGGGGFNIKNYTPFILPINEREIILVKGYQNRSGRANIILEALSTLKDLIKEKECQVVVFGATKEFEDYYSTIKSVITFPIKIYSIENKLPHIEVIKLMGKSLLYIGNSNSDGTPNTLLEAICMGAFPIQSNPGRATEDYIQNKLNGLLIDDYNNLDMIKNQISLALNNKQMLYKSYSYNLELSKELEFNHIKNKVLMSYQVIKKDLS